MDIERAKQLAAEEAVAEVKAGMRLGLGTGSTSTYAVRALGRRYAAGELPGIVGVPTSTATEKLARELQLPLTTLDACPELDLAIDGADEIDPEMNLIKGGGGALLREKAVERRAKRLIIIADESKLSPRLGTKFALPVEVPPAAWEGEQAFLVALGSAPALRGESTAPFVTDNGNYILDARFVRGISDPYRVATALDERTSVRAHGLFLDMASEVIIAGAAGVRRLST